MVNGTQSVSQAAHWRDHHSTSARPSLPIATGVGFKSVHFDALMDTDLDLGFIEIHAENYLGDGGLPHRQLSQIGERYALSIHGVGLSIGGATELDKHHLNRVAGLCERYQPAQFSEHLSWSSHDGQCFPDLLPVVYDEDTLRLAARHVDQVQNALGREILIENPSAYLFRSGSTLVEVDFLVALCQQSGCRLLLDINNLEVNCHNLGGDPLAYLSAIPLGLVGEFHLAGHSRVPIGQSGELCVDDHGSAVRASTWRWYETALARFGVLPTLIEWDNDVPDWPTLKAQADQAGTRLAGYRTRLAV